jgi:hypothetical protein
MAYDTDNPPRLLMGTLTGSTKYAPGDATGGALPSGVNLWIYTSTDVSTVVDASGFFTNGYDLGMRTGDLLICQERVSGGSTFLTTMHAVVMSGTTADIADAVAITSVTDSD